MMPRPSAACRRALLVILLAAALPAVLRAEDARLAPLKDLDGSFPFTPPATLDAWKERAAEVRQRILVSQGLWPMPEKTPLNPSLHGTITKGPEAKGNEGTGGYTVSNVSFESAPGLFVTGNLYRPLGLEENQKVPAVLFAHGHWQNARHADQDAAATRKEIANGEERFEEGGRSRFQSLCVQLARMGCVVWQWDMLSDSDAVQFSREIVHGFAKQRPEMNTAERWGLYSPQAESHLQSIMGLQTLNGIRGVDFVLSLPEVDPKRIAITGASGGGTQTMLVAAVDDRVTLSGPMVMVSTSMQGGCTCENASLLRVGTGNVEFAALFAPKPQIMNTADDWTKEFATKGFPDLQKLYGLYGAKNAVALKRGEHFPHNYNAVTRSAFYTFVNKHFALGAPEPVIERDYEVVEPAKLTVWDAEHPAPKAADPDFERDLLAKLTAESTAAIAAAAATKDGLRAVLAPAWATVIGRTAASAGEVSWEMAEKTEASGVVRMTGKLVNATHHEEIPVLWLYPKSVERQGGRVARRRWPRRDRGQRHADPGGGRDPLPRDDGDRGRPVHAAGRCRRPAARREKSARVCRLQLRLQPDAVRRAGPRRPLDRPFPPHRQDRRPSFAEAGGGGGAAVAWGESWPPPEPSPATRSTPPRSTPRASASETFSTTAPPTSCPAPANTSTSPGPSRPVRRGRCGSPVRRRCRASSPRRRRGPGLPTR
jgi:dienelactone hydrolase